MVSASNAGVLLAMFGKPFDNGKTTDAFGPLAPTGKRIGNDEGGDDDGGKGAVKLLGRG